jgi:hypothetical protein
MTGFTWPSVQSVTVTYSGGGAATKLIVGAVYDVVATFSFALPNGTSFSTPSVTNCAGSLNSGGGLTSRTFRFEPASQSQSGLTLRAEPAAGVAKDYPLSFGGTDYFAATFTAVSSVSPSSIQAGQATELTIDVNGTLGTSTTSDVRVSFGGSTFNCSSISGNTVKATVTASGNDSVSVLVRYPSSTGRSGEMGSSGRPVTVWSWPSQAPSRTSLMHRNTGADVTALTVGELYDIKFDYDAFLLPQPVNFSTSAATNCTISASGGDTGERTFAFLPTSSGQCGVTLTVSASGAGSRAYTLSFGSAS